MASDSDDAAPVRRPDKRRGSGSDSEGISTDAIFRRRPSASAAHAHGEEEDEHTPLVKDLKKLGRQVFKSRFNPMNLDPKGRRMSISAYMEKTQAIAALPKAVDDSSTSSSDSDDSKSQSDPPSRSPTPGEESEDAEEDNTTAAGAERKDNPPSVPPNFSARARVSLSGDELLASLQPDAFARPSRSVDEAKGKERSQGFEEVAIPMRAVASVYEAKGIEGRGIDPSGGGYEAKGAKGQTAAERAARTKTKRIEAVGTPRVSF
jgi:hypothetical protein